MKLAAGRKDGTCHGLGRTRRLLFKIWNHLHVAKDCYIKKNESQLLIIFLKYDKFKSTLKALTKNY